MVAIRPIVGLKVLQIHSICLHCEPLMKNNYISVQKLLFRSVVVQTALTVFNPLNAELNPICCLLALLGAHHFLRVSRIRVKSLTLRLLMSYIYIYIYIYIHGAPILDVSRSHTTTRHSR